MPQVLAALALAGLLAAGQADALRIVVIEGEDAVNIVQQKTAVAPVVEVRDRNNQPVAGAIVRFAINQGRGTFAGARTLSVTTNAAGRAIATGLTPTGGGALQIGATATFQGQTAIATIAQTNVMTAAEAAAAGGATSGASSGASTASGGAAGGGGGGGISGTTLGIVGGAVAGGAVAASTLSGGGADEEIAGQLATYSGSFSMQSVYNSDTFTNGVVTGFCHNQVVTITGTITVKLNDHGSGGIEMKWTQDEAASGQCPGHAPGFTSGGDISNASSITLENAYSSNYDAPSGTVKQTNAHRFTGALNGSVINGTVTIWQDLALIAPAAPNINQTGGFPAVSAPVTLTKQ